MGYHIRSRRGSGPDVRIALPTICGSVPPNGSIKTMLDGKTYLDRVIRTITAGLRVGVENALNLFFHLR